MIWCFVGGAVLMAVCGLAMGMVRRPHIDWRSIRPGRIARGCVITFCLMVALGCVGMALLIAAPW